MSMLSAQCERLRDAANGLDAMSLHAYAREFRDAADTIDELRTRCQELQEREWQTCHNAHVDSVEDLAAWFECSECGASYLEVTPMRHCPSCGRRIVE